MEYILQIQDLSKSFAIHKQKGRAAGNDLISVINNISINIKRGSITSLIGGNGAGKTTLFNLISGLLRPDTGLITFHDEHKGHDLVHLAPHEISRLGVGRMFQEPRAFEKLSILENLVLYLGKYQCEWPFYNVFTRSRLKKEIAHDKEFILSRIEDHLGKEHSLYKNWNTNAGSLSFAEQRILSFIGLLLSDYRLILIDEPTSGINQDFLEHLKDWLLILKKDKRTVFMIEHNMDFVRSAAEYCHYMGAGQIKYSGTPEEVLENAVVQKEYLI